MIGSWEVQVALVAALKGANIAGGRVYDAVPKNPAMPYVDIGETQSISEDVQGRDGVDEFRTVHIWSEYQGQKELLDIAGAIRSALHGKPLTVTGRLALVWVQDLRTMLDPDGRTQHGVLTIRIRHFAEEAA